MSPPDDAAPDAQIDRLLSSEELAEAVENDRFRHLLDHIPIAIAISRVGKDRQRIIYANAMFETVIGYGLSELEGKDWWVFDRYRHEDDETLTLGKAIEDGEDFLGTFRLDRADAKSTLIQAYVGLVEAADSIETFRILAVVDVTNRERAQREDFERRIRDKDLLLKELQHRVKNNLQLITALIRLESRTLESDESAAMARLAGRIESLALLYQTLSAENFGAKVDLGSYLSQIAAAVVRTHAQPGVGLETKVAYAPASINVAMPVGLLVNEILTNAFKYAFVGRSHGTVVVECRHEADGRFHIVVADDGVGMPPDATWPQRGKLGTLIVQTLRENSDQMSLGIDTIAGGGTRITLRFVHRVAGKVH
jgi:PAS domain S-box-containing protein